MAGSTKGFRNISFEIPDIEGVGNKDVRDLMYHLLELFPMMKLTSSAQKYAVEHKVPELFDKVEPIKNKLKERVLKGAH